MVMSPDTAPRRSVTPRSLVESVSAGGGPGPDARPAQRPDASVRRDQARLEAVQLEAVGEVDARGSHSIDGALTAAAWLRMPTRLTPAEASGPVRTARVLRSGALPHMHAALAAGEISGEHAQVIARAVVDAPAGAVALIEPEAVAAAPPDVRAVATLMRAFAHALDPDEADHAALRRYERAGITLSPTLDGSMAVTGLADEVTGSRSPPRSTPPGRWSPTTTAPPPGDAWTRWRTSAAATSPTPTPRAAAAVATPT